MEEGGQLCQASAKELLAAMRRGLLDRSHAKSPKFDESILEDVVVGCLSQIGEQGGNTARIASLMAKIPITAAAYTANQYCNAGLRAINSAAHQMMISDGDACVCAGKGIDDMDVIEPNEAFMSPLIEFAKELGYEYDDPRVNPTGGAVALGHPIGASGVLYFGEMVHHLKRTNGRCGLQMLCGGGGIGIATVVERL